MSPIGTFENLDNASGNLKQALDAIKKNGKTKVYTLTAAEKAECRKALMPVRKDAEGRWSGPGWRARER
jgi:hypothetical protein